jgi:hypothetical protein
MPKGRPKVHDFLRHAIPLVLSANTLALTWLVGRKSTLGWVLGVCGQVLWFVFIFMYGAYGLLPMAVGLTILYAWNLRKWLRERKEDKPEAV